MNEPARTKILFVITKSNWGGAQRYVYDLATALPQDQFEVAVAGGFPRTPLPGILEQRLAKANMPFIRIENLNRDTGLGTDWDAFWELLKLFRMKQPEIVHLNSSKAGGIGALAARIAGVRSIVFTSHGLAYDEDRNPFSRLAIFFATWVTFLLCDRVITISRDTYERASRLLFCSGKIQLIYNGISGIDFASRDDARIKIKGQAVHDVPWIGTVSEFTRNKGLSYLVAAAVLLKNRGLKFRLCLIGNDGEELSRIKNQAVESGLYNNPGSSAYIDLPGFIPDVADKMMAFEIFTLTSVKEGLPYVLLEAGQAGCAVVGSKIPGITDVIDETTGIFVEPKNPVAIADALEKLLRDSQLREKLGQNLNKRVQEKFSLERMVRETSALYDA